MEYEAATVLASGSSLGLFCVGENAADNPVTSVRSLGAESGDIVSPDFFSNPSMNRDLAYVSKASDVVSYQVEECTAN